MVFSIYSVIFSYTVAGKHSHIVILLPGLYRLSPSVITVVSVFHDSSIQDEMDKSILLDVINRCLNLGISHAHIPE